MSRPKENNEQKIRLNKFIARSGLASRREADRLIAAGAVEVNGKKIESLGHKVDVDTSHVKVRGRLLCAPPPKVYWMLNKPDFVLTSRSGEGSQRTIYDLDAMQGLPFLVHPVGRLDYHTEGLLLLTNDGDLSERLCRPHHHVPRHYLVLVAGKLAPEQRRAMEKGLDFDDGRTKPCKVMPASGVRLGASKGQWHYVTVTEGRNRLVRRLFEHFDLKVVRLVRYGFGSLRLYQDLKPGRYRQLSAKEISSLKSSLIDS